MIDSLLLNAYASHIYNLCCWQTLQDRLFPISMYLGNKIITDLEVKNGIVVLDVECVEIALKRVKWCAGHLD